MLSKLSLTWIVLITRDLDYDLWLDVNHVSPSYNPSPVVAQAGWTCQFLSRIRVNPSFSWISCGFIAKYVTAKQLISMFRTMQIMQPINPQQGGRINNNLYIVVLYIPSGRSCLLAKINIIASLISLSFIILCSSWRASSIRSRSAQSTTKINPWVPV